MLAGCGIGRSAKQNSLNHFTRASAGAGSSAATLTGDRGYGFPGGLRVGLARRRLNPGPPLHGFHDGGCDSTPDNAVGQALWVTITKSNSGLMWIVWPKIPSA